MRVKTQTNRLCSLLTLVLTIAALMVGQTAWAVEVENVAYKAYNTATEPDIAELIVPENRRRVTYDGNGNTSGSVPDVVAYDVNTTATVKGNTGNLARTGYAFTGWNTRADGDGTTYKEGDTFIITDDITLYAKWTPTYTITWLDGDGNTLKEEQVAYGETPAYTGNTPTKTATAQYTYTFNDTWSPAIVAVTEAATYTSQFDATVNKYTVTFVDEDGTTVLKAGTDYDYGTDAESIVKPADPTKAPTAEYTYTFAGWSPAITNVTDNVTYTATYNSVANPIVAYIDADGNVHNDINQSTETTDDDGVQAIPLTGRETTLGRSGVDPDNNNKPYETWYVCNTDATANNGNGLSYTNGLTLNGNVHIILADGCKMTVTNSTGNAITGNNSFAIYGQSTGNNIGSLSVTGGSSNKDGLHILRDFLISYCNVTAEGSGNGIHVSGDITINGGQVVATGTNGSGIYSVFTLSIENCTVTAEGSTYGLYGSQGVTISGGEVTATSTNDSGIYSVFITSISNCTATAIGGKFGINSSSGVTISGGQVEATGTSEYGIKTVSGPVTLGWTAATDYIWANSYSGIVSTATDKRFVAYAPIGTPGVEGINPSVFGTTASAIVSGSSNDSNPTFTLDDLEGMTLKPLDGPVVSITGEGFSFGKDADFVIANIPYYIYKENNTASLTYTGSGIVQVTGLPEGYAAVENQPMQRTFTMAAADVALTATAVTDLTATAVTYDGTARTPEIKQGDNVFDAANYAITYQLDDEAVNAAEVKNVNTYTCVLTGLGQYVGTTSVPFDITLRITNIAVEIVDPVTTIDGHPLIIAQDDAHVKVTLAPVAGANETTELPKINGYVTLSVNDGINLPKPYTVAIVNGVGHYYVSNLVQGAYDITADFDGDANHAVSTSATTLEVCKILTETTSSLDKTSIHVGESVTVTVNIKEVGLRRPVIDNETGKNKAYLFASSSPLSIDVVVTVRCYSPADNALTETGPNNFYTAIVNGQGIKTFSHIPAGPRTVTAIFAGDDRYTDSVSIPEELEVNKTETTVDVEVTSPVIAK